MAGPPPPAMEMDPGRSPGEVTFIPGTEEPGPEGAGVGGRGGLIACSPPIAGRHASLLAAARPPPQQLTRPLLLSYLSLARPAVQSWS